MTYSGSGAVTKKDGTVDTATAASTQARPLPADIDAAIDKVHKGKPFANASKKLQDAQDELFRISEAYKAAASDMSKRWALHKDLVKAEKTVERLFKSKKRLVDNAVKKVVFPNAGGTVKMVPVNYSDPFIDLWKTKAAKKTSGQVITAKGIAGLEKMLVKDVLDAVPEVTVYYKRGRRAGYYPSSNRIGMGKQDTGTIIHEFGHAIEHNLPGAQDAALAFRSARAGDEALSTIYAGTTEVGYKDEFFSHYCGRDYTNKGMPDSTEIISMGIQKVWDDPAFFYSSDPEYFDFIQTIMWGDL